MAEDLFKDDPLIFAPPLDSGSLAVPLSILSVTVLALVWVEGGYSVGRKYHHPIILSSLVVFWIWCEGGRALVKVKVCWMGKWSMLT